MIISKFISQLRNEYNITIELHSGELKINARKQDLTPEIIDKIRLRKQEIINFLEAFHSDNKSIIIPKAPEKGFYAVSPAQRRMYFSHELDDSSVAYTLSSTYNITGKLDQDKIQKVFDKLVERHVAFRTSFHIQKGELFQKVHPYDEIDFKINRIKANREDVPGVLKELILPFDLSNAPLLKVSLIEVTPTEFVLNVDMHHIISDGVSHTIIVEEFSAAYLGLALSPLEINYLDYSEWLAGKEHQSLLDKQKRFWLQEFAELPSPLEIPMDFARPSKRNYSGDLVEIELQKDDHIAFNAIAGKAGVTTFMLYLSAFHVLLSKLSGEEDLVIGVPTAGRNHEDLEKVIGVFVNTVSIRNQADGDLRFVDFLKNVKEQTLKCFDNESYPYEDLIKELNLERDLNRNPLFDVVFSHTKEEGDSEVSGSGLAIRPVKGEREITLFDIQLIVVESAEGSVKVVFRYKTSLFKKRTMERYASYFREIIRVVGSNMEVKLSEIQMIPDEELKLLESKPDLSYQNSIVDHCIHEVFESQVDQNRERTALSYKDQKLTYGELNDRSNQLAHFLRDERGVKPDELIGICVDRSLEMIVCILGVLKAGGAYVPLDPAYPSSRLQYMIEDAGMQTVLSTASTTKQLDININQELIVDVLDDLSEELSKQNLRASSIGLEPSNLAYIIYTSGSTGKPKGVMVEHRQVINLFHGAKKHFDFGSEDIWTVFHSFAFDFSVWEIWGALFHGGNCVVVPQGVNTSTSEFYELVEKEGVTVLNQTPSAFSNFIHVDSERKGNLSLRYVIFGGEELVPSSLQPWIERHGDETPMLINMYGITETTVHVTYQRIDAELSQSTLSTIGIPLPHLKVEVLDKYGLKVPFGVAGELHVGGGGVSRGYLHRESLTRSRFIKDPFDNDSSDRLYKSGDLVKYNQNGSLVYLGRIDNQVKLRGFRIELGEISNVLTSHEQVLDSIVILYEKSYLVGYVAVGDTSLLSEDFITQLRAYAKEQLPEYMVPAFIEPLDNLPLTANGKINRKALPSPNVSAMQNEYVAPVTETERGLVEIWEDLLGLDKVGIHDNFFNIGGDSIKAIRLIYEAKERLSFNLTLAGLYSNQTIAELAAMPDDNSMEEEALKRAEIEIDAFEENYRQKVNSDPSIEAVYPMSGIEKGMMFYTLLQDENERDFHKIWYHEQSFSKVGWKNFDFAKFCKVMDLMIEKHAELRKVFDIRNLAHVIKKEISPILNYWDIRHMDEQEQIRFMRKKIQEERIKATDYSGKVPLWRMNIVHINDSLLYSMLDMHHSVMDGWSLHSFLAEINNIYIMLGKDPSFKPEKLRCNYRDHIVREVRDIEIFSKDNYWQEELRDYNRFEFIPTGATHKYIGVTHFVDAGLLNEIEQLASRIGSTLKNIAFAAYLYTFKVFGGKNDFVTGMTVNNRPTIPDAEKMIGCFLNTVPFRARVPEEGTWKQFIAETDERLIKLKQHERIPLQNIVDIVGEVTSDQNPFSDISFNFIDFWVLRERMYNESEVETDDLDWGHDGRDSNQNTLLDFHFRVQQDYFQIDIEYSTTIADADFIDRLCKFYEETLKQIVRDVNADLDSFTLISKEEQELFSLWNQTNQDFQHQKCVHELFEEQVLLNQDRVALVYKDEQLTYGELNEKANQLAHYLRETKEVKTDGLVGICLDKSFEVIISMLGVLKSGGAYVPIDPDYPLSRIEYMIQDASVEVVISTSEITDRIGLQLKSGVVVDISSEISPALSKKNLSLATTGVTSDNLAYTIYTSGSSGKPKGVSIAHQSLVNYLTHCRSHYIKTEGQAGSFMHLSTTFDASLTEIYTPLISGRYLVIGSKSGVDVFSDENLFKHAPYDFMKMTPSHVEFLRPVMQSEGKLLAKEYILGGEPISPHHISTLKKHSEGSQITNEYGPTEATVGCCTFTVGNSEDIPVPIGTPILNTSVYVLDANLKQVPVGVAGELYIGGRGLAKYYLNRHELTKDRFIRHPFSENDSDRLYRSGDLVKYLPDGNLLFIGRIDDQVKLRGFRIELGEIANALATHEKVNDASVILHEETQLVAYVAVGEVSDLAEDFVETLLSFAKQLLPAYMIPSFVIPLDRLPINSNGKLDRKSLPAPDASAMQKVYVAPSTEKEKIIAGIWENLLKVEKVGMQDNFFHLGGNSLSMILLTNRLKAHGFAIAVKDIFSYPTLVDLVSKVRTYKEEYMVPENLITRECTKLTPDMLPLVATISQESLDGLVDRIPGGISNIEDIYPLAPLQEGMFFHSDLHRDQRDPYVISSILSFSSRKQLDSFVTALQAIVDRHDVLRTSIHSDALLEPLQVVQRQAVLKREPLSLHLNEGENLLTSIEKRVFEEGIMIDLQQAPLMSLHDVEDPLKEVYYLVFSWHHLIMDHIGLEQIVREVSLYYRDEFSNLPAPSLYREFVGNVQHLRSSVDYLSYFKTRFSQVETPTLCFDYSDTKQDGGQILELNRLISDRLSKSIRELSKRHNITPATLFHAAWGIVAERTSESEDSAVFGTVLFGRIGNAQDSLGLYINTLPLCLQLSQTAKEYVQHAYEELTGLVNHEQVSLTELKSLTRINRDLPLFNSLLNYRYSLEKEDSESVQDGLDTSGINLLRIQERTNYPIVLSIDDLGEGFGLTAQVTDKLGVSPETILGYVEKVLDDLLNALAVDEDVHLSSIDMLSEKDKAELSSLHQPDRKFVSEKCIHEVFEDQVKNSPDKIALVIEDQSLTYRELNVRANQLAHCLRKSKQIRPDDLVGICLDRSLEMIISILGVLKAGGAYVPLDPGYPSSRLEYMIEDATLKTVITTSTIMDQLDLPENLPILDIGTESLADYSKADLSTSDLGLNSTHLAYIIYTSGSTGKPKGVMVEHRQVVRLFESSEEHFDFGSNDVWSVFHSFAFDFSVWEIWGGLLYGGKCVLVPKGVAASTADFYQLVEREGVTILNQTPSAFSNFIYIDEEEKGSLQLRYVIFGGEALVPSTLQPWINRHGLDFPVLVNMYGITETTVHVTYQKIDRDMIKSPLSAIGIPLADLNVEILDKHGNLVPVGVAGELHVGGGGVTRGYLNREELTKERFIQNPFSENPEDRLYKTGDLVKYQQDGSLIYLGRIDNQVKVRGYRIELGEISNALSTHPMVKDAVVSLHDQTHLVGYVAVGDTTTLPKDFTDEVVNYLSTELPGYMVPSFIVSMNRFPLTANGKVDRKALPVPDIIALQQEYVAPTNDIEKKLTQIACEVIGLSKIGIRDNLFNLGMHSLMIARVRTKIQQELDITIPIINFFTYKTIEELATYVTYAMTKQNEKEEGENVFDLSI